MATMAWRWLWAPGLACALATAGPARGAESFEITPVPEANALSVSG